MRLRLHRPRPTVRWRLTLLYGSLFLVSGAALLAITYTLVEHAPIAGPDKLQDRLFTRRPPAFSIPKGFRGQLVGPPRALTPAQAGRIKRLLRTPTGQIFVSVAGSGQRISDLHTLVIESAIALAIMAVISTFLGWLVAGRVLRPLRTMTATTRQISEANLHERLAMQGPRDELRQLADTIDGLLGRLEGAFDAQRRFVANASHELRTPLTAARAVLEMVLSDPHATMQTFRSACRQVLEESEHQEHLIDALLLLAQSQRGIVHGQELDLAEVATEVLRAHEAKAADSGLHLDVSVHPAPIFADARLVERLVTNLVHNAIVHNVRDGRVGLVVADQGGQVTLTVTNTGPPVPADQVQRLMQPFQRLSADRVGHGSGLGLGLSIVAAIAAAHHAVLEVEPGSDGGLSVQVRFPGLAGGDKKRAQAVAADRPMARLTTGSG